MLLENRTAVASNAQCALSAQRCARSASADVCNRACAPDPHYTVNTSAVIVKAPASAQAAGIDACPPRHIEGRRPDWLPLTSLRKPPPAPPPLCRWRELVCVAARCSASRARTGLGLQAARGSGASLVSDLREPATRNSTRDRDDARKTGYRARLVQQVSRTLGWVKL
jgi:hypothetical protein